MMHQRNCIAEACRSPLDTRAIREIVFILCIVLSSCNTTNPTQLVDLRSATVHASIPGGTEATVGVSVSFQVVHESTAIPLIYEWNFDDGTAILTTDSTARSHRFAKSGFFGVIVRILRLHDKVELARPLLVVNARGAAPAIDLVTIPAGSFMMGSWRHIDVAEEPVHRVTLSTALEVSRFELMQWQWNAVMPTSGSWFQSDSLPVETVSWVDAADLCNRLSLRKGYQPCYIFNGAQVSCDISANGFRLPTEAEWEYCARAGTATDFYSGDAVQPYAACLESDSPEPCVDSVAWYCHNSNVKSHTCGTRAPNSFGLFDMIGNVAEWTNDWFDSKTYSQSPTHDPQGSSTGTVRVVRGGDFSTGVIDIRASSRRLSLKPDQRLYSVGFRLVRRP